MTVRSGIDYVVLTLISAVVLVLADLVLPGFRLTRIDSATFLGNIPSALILAVVFGALNAVLWPLFLRAMMWVGPALLFIGVFFASWLLMLLSITLVPVARFDGPLDTTILALVLSATTSVASGAMAARRDSTYRTMVVRRHRNARGKAAAQFDSPGLVCIQLDGLGHDVLVRAMASGVAPTLAGLVRSGSHTIVPWHTDWSSQTGASQLGILHGSNHNVPAFRWLDKTTGTVAVFSNPASNAERERERAHLPGLLSDDGASRGNLFTGGAADNVLVVSRMNGARLGGGGTGYSAYFIDPANTIRTTVRFVAEIVRELRQSIGTRLRGFQPTVPRGGIYPLIRGFTTVVETDVVVASVIGDMVHGRSIVYADLVGYDEVSHHSGVERTETLSVLRKLDAEIAMIDAVARSCERHYELVVLSDHGQSQGATFSRRYGESLETLVLRGCGAPREALHDKPMHGGGAEGSGYAAASVGIVSTEWAAPTEGSVVVLASGNVGLVSFLGCEGRATREWIEENHPTLLPSLTGHPGIGFVLVATDAGDSVVLGAEGSVDVATGRVEGVDPLATFGPDALASIARTDSFDNVADVMINGTYWPEVDEVAAFEEQVGSHGGLGGQQTRPFLMFPSVFEPPTDTVKGAEGIHRLLAGWRAAQTQP